MNRTQLLKLPDSQYLCSFCEGRMKVLGTISPTSEKSVCVECLEIVLISTAYGFPASTRMAFGGEYLELSDDLQAHQAS